MAKNSVAASLLTLGCFWTLLGVAHAQSAGAPQPELSAAWQTAERVARLSTSSDPNQLVASPELHAGWPAFLAPGANSANVVLADAALLSPLPHRRRGSERFTLLLSWAYAPSELKYTETHTFTKYVEDAGRLTLDYSQPAQSGFTIDGRVVLWHGLGLQLGYSTVSRSGSVKAAAEIPDLFYFQKNRSVTHDAGGFAWREGTVHLDAAYDRAVGPVRVAIFAGASVLLVKADLASELAYTQVYPYASENVTVTALRSQRISKNAVGPDAGVAVDVPIARHFGLGALVRYGGARITLTRPGASTSGDSDGAVTGEQVVQAPPGSSLRIDARGVQVALGARLFF
jgi:hypothetical protein